MDSLARSEILLRWCWLLCKKLRLLSYCGGGRADAALALLNLPMLSGAVGAAVGAARCFLLSMPRSLAASCSAVVVVGISDGRSSDQ